MPGTTAKGVPYSLGADAASTIDDTMLTLAQWLDARPGVAIVTTAQRNALAAPDLWIGKVVYTTDTVGGARLEICTGLGPPATWRGVTISALVTDAQRDAFGATDVWPGRTIWNTTSNEFQIYTGAGWASVNGTIAPMATAARTALAGDDLWTGRTVFDTTVLDIFVYDGATWRAGMWAAAGDLVQGSATVGTPSRLAAPTNGRARLHWNPSTLLLEWVNEGTNMLPNPSARLGFLGWLPAGGWRAWRTPISGTPFNVWSGGGYFGDTLNGNAAFNLISNYGYNLNAAAAVDMVLSAWVHTGNATGGGGVDLIAEAWTGAAWSAFATINVPNNNGNGNTGLFYWVHGVTPTGTTKVRVKLVAHEGTANTDIAVGRIKLEMGAVPSPFTDDATALDILAPICRVHTTTVSGYANNNTFVVGNWTVDEDNYSAFDVANNRYTVPVDGLYHVEGQINIAGLAATYPLNLLVQQNAASTNLATPQITGNHSATVDDVMIVSDDIRCVVGDNLRLAIYQNSGSTLNLQSAYYKIRRVAA